MKMGALILSAVMVIGFATLGHAQSGVLCITQQMICSSSCRTPSCLTRCTEEAQRCILSDAEAAPPIPSVPGLATFAPRPTHPAPTHVFDPKPLKNWGTFDSAKGMIRVSVRDHECEDGDRLRVAVNGEGFETDLTNRWEMREFILRQGQNRIDILAVNGSGYKGRCNYQNVNTGEISVTTYRQAGAGIVPDKFATQDWKLRAGAGSTSSIFINVK